MKAYRIYNCRIEGGKSWSGVVISDNTMTVSEAIRAKFGLKVLYCEEYPDKYLKEKNRLQYDCCEIPVNSVNISDLTVGEFKKIMREIC